MRATRCALCAVNDRLRQLQRLDVDALENDDTAEESAKAPEKQEKGSEGAAPRDVTMGRSGDVMMLSAVQEEEKKKEEEGEDGAPQPPVRTRRGPTCLFSCSRSPAVAPPCSRTAASVSSWLAFYNYCHMPQVVDPEAEAKEEEEEGAADGADGDKPEAAVEEGGV